MTPAAHAPDEDQRSGQRPVLAELQRTLDEASQECLAAMRALERTIEALTAGPPPVASTNQFRQAQSAFAITQAAWEDLQALWAWERGQDGSDARGESPHRGV
jgi:hypothetical protein